MTIFHQVTHSKIFESIIMLLSLLSYSIYVSPPSCPWSIFSFLFFPVIPRSWFSLCLSFFSFSAPFPFPCPPSSPPVLSPFRLSPHVSSSIVSPNYPPKLRTAFQAQIRPLASRVCIQITVFIHYDPIPKPSFPVAFFGSASVSPGPPAFSHDTKNAQAGARFRSCIGDEQARRIAAQSGPSHPPCSKTDHPPCSKKRGQLEYLRVPRAARVRPQLATKPIMMSPS